jgi:hypothetical protein
MYGITYFCLYIKIVNTSWNSAFYILIQRNGKYGLYKDCSIIFSIYTYLRLSCNYMGLFLRKVACTRYKLFWYLKEKDFKSDDLKNLCNKRCSTKEDAVI